MAANRAVSAAHHVPQLGGPTLPHCFCLGAVFKVNKCKFGYLVFSLFGWICIVSSRLFTHTFKDVK